PGSDDDPWMWHVLPDALLRHNQIALARIYQKRLLPMFDEVRGVVDVTAVGQEIRRREEEETGASALLFFTWSTAYTTERAHYPFAEGQAWVAMARLACVLERYRLAAGDYPGELAALVPEFIDAIPPDPAGGGDLHYQRTDDGRFVLYSVGRNGRDDGGKLVFYKDRLVNTWAEDCDWVWTYPVD
ncbi:MAG: hypothetical protein KDM81_01555, partial [Verrucomicrobiae bacterium]|nr:hypothetical protein [Verrucomicrobiae bacterium]